MGVLKSFGIEYVHHYAPLHYLVFIARGRTLLSKPALIDGGFPRKHFRSKSRSQDMERGFAGYTFLTLDPAPPILGAKLSAGFPHIQVVVPAEIIDRLEYSLCRFNVAMTRFLRRENKPGFPESASNGRYYARHQIPIARAVADKAAMLSEHLQKGTMIEVLVRERLALPDETVIACYSSEDAATARSVLDRLGSPWGLTIVNPPNKYPRNIGYVAAVTEFIEIAVADPNWRGNGLEFDRV